MNKSWQSEILEEDRTYKNASDCKVVAAVDDQIVEHQVGVLCRGRVVLRDEGPVLQGLAVDDVAGVDLMNQSWR
jgi:hypothetical protein